jgi:hypothetical protein
VSETLGGLSDQLSIINIKLFMAQEFVIEAGTTHPEAFLKKYTGEQMLQKLALIHKLNTERNRLITAIDSLFNEGLKLGRSRVDERVKLY